MISIGSRRITGIYLGSSRVKAVSVGALEIWGGLPSPSLVVETASPIKVSGQAPFKQLFFIKARIDNDDGQHRIEYSYPQLSYVRGDGPSFAISSASELNESFDVTVRLMRGDAMVSSQTVNVQVAISSSVELSVPNLSLSVSGEAGTDVRGSIGATIDNDDGHHSLRYEYPSKPWLSGNGDSFTVNSPSELNESFAVRVVLIKDMEGEVSSETVTVSVKIAAKEVPQPSVPVDKFIITFAPDVSPGSLTEEVSGTYIQDDGRPEAYSNDLYTSIVLSDDKKSYKIEGSMGTIKTNEISGLTDENKWTKEKLSQITSVIESHSGATPKKVIISFAVPVVDHFRIMFDGMNVPYNGNYVKTSEMSAGLPVYQMEGNSSARMKYCQNSGSEWQILFASGKLHLSLVKKMNTAITQYTQDNLGGRYEAFTNGMPVDNSLTATVTV